MSSEDPAGQPATGAWDSARYMAPNPALPVEQQLAWYKVAAHVLLLNCSEQVRRAAAGEADKALDRRAVTGQTGHVLFKRQN